jgi:polar amino acid transport system substrate-binding protein
MKKILCVILLLCSATAIADNKNLTLTSDYWCPWVCSDSQNPGFSVEVAQAIYKPLGYNVTVQPMSWVKSIAAARSGKITAAIGGDKMDTSISDFVFPETPIAVQSNIFVSLKKANFEYKNINSLKKLKIGIVSGYHFDGEIGQYIEQNYGNSRIIMQALGKNASENMLKKLAIGKVNLYVDDADVINYLLQKAKIADQITIGSKVGNDMASYLIFSPALPNSKGLAAEFDEGMKRIKADGSYDSIMAKYSIVKK